MGFHHVAAEIEDVAGIVEIPVVLLASPREFTAQGACTLPQTGVIGNGGGAVSRKKNVGYERFGARRDPPMVEHELFRSSFIANLAQAARQLVQRLVPGNLLPLAVASTADPSEGLQNSVGIINLQISRLPLCAQFAKIADGLRLTLEFGDILAVQIGQGGAPAGTHGARGGYGITFGTRQTGKILSALLEYLLLRPAFSRSGQQNRRSGGHRTQFQEFTPINHHTLPISSDSHGTGYLTRYDNDVTQHEPADQHGDGNGQLDAAVGDERHVVQHPGQAGIQLNHRRNEQSDEDHAHPEFHGHLAAR